MTRIRNWELGGLSVSRSNLNAVQQVIATLPSKANLITDSPQFDELKKQY